MARLGYLFLNQGNWNGRQIVSRAWVELSTGAYHPRIGVTSLRRYPALGYGFLMATNILGFNAEPAAEELRGPADGAVSSGLEQFRADRNLFPIHRTART